MTLAECKKEFQTMYDMSSYGAPDLNNYEISLFLTQAIRDIVNEIYQNFEHTEYVKRGLGPLIKEQSLAFVASDDYFDAVEVIEAILPDDMYYILQENVKLSNKKGKVEVIAEDLDYINKSIKNPFRRPNKNKVLRTQIGDKRVRLYSSEPVTHFKIKYIKKHSPIVLTDFTTDPDLLGTETINGKNKPTMTELPEFLHDKIIKRGVLLAIKSFRENNLQTQANIN